LFQNTQLKNYARRIKGAHILRQFIKAHHFNHLVVPQKWLYELPSFFAENNDTKAYILIVENMDIYDDWNNPQGEARKLYYTMDKEKLTQLCMTCMIWEGAMLFLGTNLSHGREKSHSSILSI